jgi:hypothetical protein
MWPNTGIVNSQHNRFLVITYMSLALASSYVWLGKVLETDKKWKNKHMGAPPIYGDCKYFQPILIQLIQNTDIMLASVAVTF